MYKVIHFSPEHLDCMQMREHEAKLCEDREGVAELAKRSVAKTALLDGRIICCWGHVDTYHGTAELWLIPSVYLPKMPLSFYKGVKSHLDAIADGFNRVQTHCIHDNLHNRWMKFLGFTKEGVLKKFWHGADYAVWGRTWE